MDWSWKRNNFLISSRPQIALWARAEQQFHDKIFFPISVSRSCYDVGEKAVDESENDLESPEDKTVMTTSGQDNLKKMIWAWHLATPRKVELFFECHRPFFPQWSRDKLTLLSS